jgi:hypothetical protein
MWLYIRAWADRQQPPRRVERSLPDGVDVLM